MNDSNTAPKLYPPDVVDFKQSLDNTEFSLFLKPVQNIIPSKSINAKTAYNLIRSEVYATPTHVLRELTDKAVARNYKARNFDYVCFSGVFTKRSENGLIKHSNFLTLDFDGIDEAEKLKRLLIKDDRFETVLAFISPSGNGVKWVVKIDINKYSHLQWFYAIANYIRLEYNLIIDKSGKDVCRCCFLPYDPDCYINPKYLL